MSIKNLTKSGLNTEFKRKLIHLFAIWVPLTYLFVDKQGMLTILFPVTFVVLFIDSFRHHIEFIGKIFNKIFGSVLRSHETGKGKLRLTGASYMLVSSAFVVASFDKYTALLALYVVVISDTVAAMVGLKYGKIKVAGKTIEGTLAFFFSALLIIFTMHYVYNIAVDSSIFIASFFALVLTSIIELYSQKLKIDDNILIPISLASFMLLFEYYLS